MFTTITTLFKTYRAVAIIGVGLALAGTTWYFWGSYKDSIYQEGYDAAVAQYSEQMSILNEKNRQETEQKLRQLRFDLAKQHQKEVERLKSEVVVDTEVKTITEYIDREIYVKEECNTVDPDLVGMFNKTINRINNSSDNR